MGNNLGTSVETQPLFKIGKKIWSELHVRRSILLYLSIKFRPAENSADILQSCLILSGVDGGLVHVEKKEATELVRCRSSNHPNAI